MAKHLSTQTGTDIMRKASDSRRLVTHEEFPQDCNGTPYAAFSVDRGDGHQWLEFAIRSPLAPAELNPRERGEFDDGTDAPFAVPGTYTVSLAKRLDGVTTALGAPQTFEVVALDNPALTPADREAKQAFEQKSARLQRAMLGANALLGDAHTRVKLLRKALDATNAPVDGLVREAKGLEGRLSDLDVTFYGDNVMASHNEPTPPSLVGRVNQATGGGWGTSLPPTRTHERNIAIATGEFDKALGTLRAVLACLTALIMTFMVGPAVRPGVRGAGVRLQLDRDGRATNAGAGEDAALLGRPSRRTRGVGGRNSSATPAPSAYARPSSVLRVRFSRPASMRCTCLSFDPMRSAKAASSDLSARIFTRRVRPSEAAEISRSAPLVNGMGPRYPAARNRKSI